MNPGSDEAAELSAAYAERLVLAAWQVSRAMRSSGEDELRRHQQRIFALLAAMVRARARGGASSPDVDRGLRPLATQAMRFVLCSPDNLRSARSIAQGLGERAFPLLRRFNDGAPGSAAALAATDRNVIRVDFGARRGR